MDAPPVPLTEKGKQQIKALAKKLKKEQVAPDIIISSPLLRTVESTKEITHVFPQTPVFYDDNLQEYDGDLTDMTIDEIDALGDYYHAKEALERNIEQPESIIERMSCVVKGTLEIHREKTIFLVSHGDPIALLFWRLTSTNEEIPSPVDLHKHNFLLQGQALKLVFDEKDSLKFHQIIDSF